jgi:hypothetical protein
MGCIMMPWDFEELNQWQLSFKQQQMFIHLDLVALNYAQPWKKVTSWVV